MSEDCGCMPATIEGHRFSASLGQIGQALAKAQGLIDAARRDSVGQIGQQKTRYADLASIRDACRDALAANDLCVVQTPTTENAPRVTVHTMLLHKSGEWIAGSLSMHPTQQTPQAIGSCITYARRYALAAMVGVAPDDDDGYAASSGYSRPQTAAQQAPAPNHAAPRPAPATAPQPAQATPQPVQAPAPATQPQAAPAVNAPTPAPLHADAPAPAVAGPSRSAPALANRVAMLYRDSLEPVAGNGIALMTREQLRDFLGAMGALTRGDVTPEIADAWQRELERRRLATKERCTTEEAIEF